MKKRVHAAQTSFSAPAGNRGMVPLNPPESKPARGAVPAVDNTAPLYVGRGHGLFIELLARVPRGERQLRQDDCRKCNTYTPHEYVCLQPAGPRVWGYECTHCRREHADLSRT